MVFPYVSCKTEIYFHLSSTFYNQNALPKLSDSVWAVDLVLPSWCSLVCYRTLASPATRSALGAWRVGARTVVSLLLLIPKIHRAFAHE